MHVPVCAVCGACEEHTGREKRGEEHGGRSGPGATLRAHLGGEWSQLETSWGDTVYGWGSLPGSERGCAPTRLRRRQPGDGEELEPVGTIWDPCQPLALIVTTFRHVIRNDLQPEAQTCFQKRVALGFSAHEDD